MRLHGTTPSTYQPELMLLAITWERPHLGAVDDCGGNTVAFKISDGDEPQPRPARDHRAEILELMLSIEAKLALLKQSSEARSVAEGIQQTIRELREKLKQPPPPLLIRDRMA